MLKKMDGGSLSEVRETDGWCDAHLYAVVYEDTGLGVSPPKFHFGLGLVLRHIASATSLWRKDLSPLT